MLNVNDTQQALVFIGSFVIPFTVPLNMKTGEQ